jgi:hypothetical protein
MRGCLDQVNRETISGWIFGDLKDLIIEIDGERYCTLDIKTIARPDVLKVYKEGPVSGFIFETPAVMNNGKLHTISIKHNSKNLNNSPNFYRNKGNKLFFIHIPKTGGTSLINCMRLHKSATGLDHVEGLLFSPKTQVAPEAWNSLTTLKKISLNKNFIKDNKIDRDVNWLAGHVYPYNARNILNKFYYFKEYRNIINIKRYNNKIYDFELISMVRNPIHQLLSQLNWYYEIYQGRHKNFLYEHTVEDIGKISFYISHLERNAPSILSQIINLNLLNAQCKYINPEIIIDSSDKNVREHVKQFNYIARCENFSESLRNIIHKDFNFDVSKLNITNHNNIDWNDLDSNLKNFIYKRLSPDFILYNMVCEVFG